MTGSLLDDYGVGVLAGEAFGDDPKAWRFRVATSLLYGRTEDERWQALRSPSLRSSSNAASRMSGR